MRVTYDRALRDGIKLLTPVSDNAALDVAQILAQAAGRDRSWIHTHADEAVSTPALATFKRLLDRRQHAEPLAYITGHAEFFGRVLTVSPFVLVPRPSTEALVEHALILIQSLSKKYQRPLTVADIGTGSGCIAITILLEADATLVSQVFATDISKPALSIAKQNALTYQVEDRLTFLLGNLTEPLAGKQIDLFVSNPPYVPSQEVTVAYTTADSSRQGLAFEPRIALDGGIDGQDYLNALIQQNRPLLAEVTGGHVRAFNL